MAFSATASQGFERVRNLGDNESFLIPGDPGVTYDEGDLVSMSYGVPILATDSVAGIVGRVTKKVICPAATVAMPRPQDLNIGNAPTNVENCLVQVEPIEPIRSLFRCSFRGQYDDTVVSYVAGTRAIALTTGCGADDRPNGSFIYIYEGTGKGQLNIVEDYDHAGGAAELLLITHRPWTIAPDSTSKVIILSGEAASNAGVGPFCRCDNYDEDQLDVADGYDNGNLVVVLDWRKAAETIGLGMLQVRMTGLLV